jgi:hypothetical protein
LPDELNQAKNDSGCEGFFLGAHEMGVDSTSSVWSSLIVTVREISDWEK